MFGGIELRAVTRAHEQFGALVVPHKAAGVCTRPAIGDDLVVREMQERGGADLRIGEADRSSDWETLERGEHAARRGWGGYGTFRRGRRRSFSDGRMGPRSESFDTR